MQEKLGSGYRLSILVFNWAEKPAECLQARSVSVTVLITQGWELRSQGSPAPAAVAVTAGPGSAQVSRWVLALPASVRYNQWGLPILAVLRKWQNGDELVSITVHG